MTSFSRPGRIVSLLAAAVVVLAVVPTVAAGAATRLDAVTQATTGPALALVRVGTEIRVIEPSGTAVRLELPDATELSRIEPLADGWVAAGSRWYSEGVDLYVLEARGDESVELPAPAGFHGPPRLFPQLAVADGRLVGLVWLEGLEQHELTVWAAPWNEGGWGEPELVSPAGPGAQLMPSVAVLDDGSWLLVWAAVDGEDDEILWSRRGPDGWSAPARVHSDNSIPDITPVVTAIRGGAMVVWSFLDRRDFRLASARFDGTGWTVSPPFGVKGSHRPLFLTRDGRPALVYRTSVPPGWAVVDYDEAGLAVRESFLARSGATQLLVDPWATQGVRFVDPSAPEEARREALAPWEPVP